MPDLRVILPAWGEMSWLAYPCLESLKRHWPTMPKSVTVMSNDKGIKLPDGVDFFLMDPARFSESLIRLLKAVKEPIIFWTVADLFWLGDLNDDIYTLAEYMMQRTNVLRMNFSHIESIHRKKDPKYRRIDSYRGIEIGMCGKIQACSLTLGMSMDAGLFHRELWVSVLNPNWTLWECEQLGTTRILKDNRLLGLVINPPIAERIDLSSEFYDIYWHQDDLLKEDRKLIDKHKPKAIEWEAKRKKYPIPRTKFEPPIVIRPVPTSGIIKVRYIGKRTKHFQCMGQVSRQMYKITGRGHVFDVDVRDIPFLEKSGTGKDFIVWE